MKVCIPVLNDEAIISTVIDHFGSAPAFMIVDRDTNAVATIWNGDRHHAQGACNPLKALDNQKIDAVVVGGIGVGVLAPLGPAGIKVYRTGSRTV